MQANEKRGQSSFPGEQSIHEVGLLRLLGNNLGNNRVMVFRQQNSSTKSPTPLISTPSTSKALAGLNSRHAGVPHLEHLRLPEGQPVQPDLLLLIDAYSDLVTVIWRHRKTGEVHEQPCVHGVGVTLLVSPFVQDASDSE